MSNDPGTTGEPICPEDLSGLSLDPARLLAVHEAYRPILDEIRKLRELDVQAIHPAVIFDPAAVYRERGQ
jgi:hypothetical protein